MKISETRDCEILSVLSQGVQELHVQLYPDYFKEYDYNVVKEFFESMVNNPNFIFLLLEDESRYFGYAMIEIKRYQENPFKKAYQSLYIHQFSIVDSYRKKGYGSKIMEKIEEIANAKKIRKLELDYWCANTIAKEFYRKCGFITCREFVYKII
ncbi:GNAT family N-acetyltransferase [Bacillus sp. 165]|uniref:GNAT family N-acetyltransferase n=1 Tax=Bacillus sp. 165 TaxID=1529117 RepID=UPI001AD959CA|nr:GNAT family N-acetyltransferase [Bacillus sp. 165]MBO9129353.1 GNAT family N-acetyltransferase [Bacillus sp. 165]